MNGCNLLNQESALKEKQVGDEPRVMARLAVSIPSAILRYSELAPRKIVRAYAVLCGVVILIFGQPALFFTQGILVLPIMALAMASWRAQTLDADHLPNYRESVRRPARPLPGPSGRMRTEWIYEAAAFFLLAIIAMVIVSFAFALAEEGIPIRPQADRGSATPEITGNGFPASAYILLGIITLSATLLTSAGRRVAAKFTHIDPRSFRHGVGLSLISVLVLSMITPLLVRGVPPRTGIDHAAGVQGTSMVYELLWFVPLAFVAVGWPAHRQLREALARLGLGRLTVRKVMVGVFAGLAMAAGAALLLDPMVRWVWDLAGWPHSDVGLTPRLFGWAFNPWSALLVGITAGVSEELLVRGVLQPRFGLIVSNLAFAALHTYGYGWDGVVSVFILGCALGVLRARTNTTTAICAHGLYDFATLLGFYLMT